MRKLFLFSPIIVGAVFLGNLAMGSQRYITCDISGAADSAQAAKMCDVAAQSLTAKRTNGADFDALIKDGPATQLIKLTVDIANMKRANFSFEIGDAASFHGSKQSKFGPEIVSVSDAKGLDLLFRQIAVRIAREL